MKDKVSLFELFITFAKVGVLTFGGGLVMLPILIREVSEKKGWVTEDELADYFAIGQCTPGIIAVNTATFAGKKTRGNPGGIVATLGVVFPSVIIITLLAGIISRFSDNPYVVKAFEGIRICICVLVLNTIFKLSKTAFKGKVTVFVFLIISLICVAIKPSPIIIVISILALGIISAKLKISLEGLNE